MTSVHRREYHKKGKNSKIKEGVYLWLEHRPALLIGFGSRGDFPTCFRCI